MGNTTAKSNMPLTKETITYPRMDYKNKTDPCTDTNNQFEHFLDCGHLIVTLSPNEPCAPNCALIAKDLRRIPPELVPKEAKSRKHFYCDACVEEENEKRIMEDMKDRESKRRTLRFLEALKRDKKNAFRACYIAYKITSVPCEPYEDRKKMPRPKGKYVPESDHPCDTAVPRSGENMFEGVVGEGVEEWERKQSPKRKREEEEEILAPLKRRAFGGLGEGRSLGWVSLNKGR